MLKPFEELGSKVAKAWEERGRGEEVFSEIATEALRASNVLTTITAEEIIEWVINSKQMPSQDAHDFGQPPINLYVGEGFYIQALFWIDSTTAIHEHSFSGAFGVLQGSSVHSTYSFVPKKVASRRLMVGQIDFLSSELLERGAVRTIHSGERLIHALFHLDRPSVSLVVRTSPKADLERPQYAYLKPFLAFNDVNLPKVQIIQLRMLESLFVANRNVFWRVAGDLVAQGDPFILCQVLAIAHKALADSSNWNTLLDRIAPENKELVEYILPCLKEGDRINRFLTLRETVHDPTHRFFIALLLNVPQREQIYKLVAQRFPASDPQALALQWLSEIFGQERAGIRITPPALFLIEKILEEPDFERSKAEVKKYFEGCADLDEDKLRNSWMQIQNVDVLKPLLTTAQVM